MSVASPDLAAAASAVDLAKGVVDSAARHLAEHGGRQAVDANQVVVTGKDGKRERARPPFVSKWTYDPAENRRGRQEGQRNLGDGCAMQGKLRSQRRRAQSPLRRYKPCVDG